MTLKRAAWLTLGILALGLGILGVALPLLPTTPFLLLAAFAFARSSNRLHNWLIRHHIFGPIIEHWRRYGAIDRRTKIVGTVSMVLIFALSFAMRISPIVLIVQGMVLTACAAFVLSRPAPPEM